MVISSIQYTVSIIQGFYEENQTPLSVEGMFHYNTLNIRIILSNGYFVAVIEGFFFKREQKSDRYWRMAVIGGNK